MSHHRQRCRRANDGKSTAQTHCHAAAGAGDGAGQRSSIEGAMREFVEFEATRRSVTFKLRGEAITLAKGARLRVFESDPTVDRIRLAELVREGALRPCGGFRRVGNVVWR
jgi:hypothetical protein